MAGRQRIRAAIKAGLKEIPVLVRDAPSREERLKICVSENLYRRNSSPKEIFRAYRTLYGLNQIWTINAEDLIPQLKEVVTDPDIQTFEPLAKCSVLAKVKEGEDFNRRNTGRILRIKI